jgi:hypothetical protein
MFKLRVDFNDVREGHVRGLVEDASGPRALRTGDRVLLHDDEHEAWGTVSAVEGGLVRAAIDCASWGPPRHREVQPVAWWAPPSEVHRAESPPQLVEILSPRNIAYGATLGIARHGTNSTGPKPAKPVHTG